MTINKITTFVEKAIKALSQQNIEPKYVNVSHIYRDVLKKANQLEEIAKLEKAWGIKIRFF